MDGSGPSASEPDAALLAQIARDDEGALRELYERHAARLGGLWSVAVVLAWDSLHGHGWAMLGQGLAAVVFALGWTSWSRARGAATPGNRFDVVVIPAAVACALVRPVADRILVFPYLAAPSEDWARSGIGWTVVGVIGSAAALAALADGPWWRTRRRACSVHSEA